MTDTSPRPPPLPVPGLLWDSYCIKTTQSNSYIYGTAEKHITCQTVQDTNWHCVQHFIEQCYYSAGKQCSSCHGLTSAVSRCKWARCRSVVSQVQTGLCGRGMWGCICVYTALSTKRHKNVRPPGRKEQTLANKILLCYHLRSLSCGLGLHTILIDSHFYNCHPNIWIQRGYGQVVTDAAKRRPKVRRTTLNQICKSCTAVLWNFKALENYFPEPDVSLKWANNLLFAYCADEKIIPRSNTGFPSNIALILKKRQKTLSHPW